MKLAIEEEVVGRIPLDLGKCRKNFGELTRNHVVVPGKSMHNLFNAHNFRLAALHLF